MEPQMEKAPAGAGAFRIWRLLAISGRRGQGGHGAMQSSNGEVPNADVHANDVHASGGRARDAHASVGGDDHPNAGGLR